MKYTIQIPKPCNESWSKMTPTEKGRFCANCEKEVFDFTSFSDDELAKKLGNQQNLCGRFRTEQINKEIGFSESNYFSKIAVFLGLTSILSVTTPIFAQTTTPKIENVANDKKSFNNKKTSNKKDDFVIITGTVVDDEQSPIPWTQVVLKGSIFGTVTDVNGYFSVTIPISSFENNPKLVFTSVEYKSTEVAINSNTKTLRVSLLVDTEILKLSSVKEEHLIKLISGVVGGVVIVKRISFFGRIKNLFRKKNKSCSKPKGSI